MNTREPEQLLAGPALFLDAAGPMSFVGILQDSRWVEWAASEHQALESLFILTRDLLRKHDLHLNHIRAFGFCDGPGSVLGLRLASACLLTWQKFFPHPLPIFHYHSLELARRAILHSLKANPKSWLLTDFRKNRWLGTPLDKVNCIMEMDTSFFSTPGYEGELYYLPQRKSWAPPPVGHQRIDYPFDSLPIMIQAGDFGTFHPTPGLAMRGKSDYQKWIPARHRRPPENRPAHE